MANTNKIIQPYSSVPYIPLNEVSGFERNGAQFFANVKQLSVGFGSRVFRVDRDGMWAGAESFAGAPWSVDWDGNMVATSITISGYIPTGGALNDIGAGNITNTYIGSNAISTGNIQTNAITSTKISASAITASKIEAGAVVAGKIAAGAIDGITITGSLIRTSSSGDRVELDDASDSIRIYDTGGVKRMELIHDTLNFYTAAGTNAGIIYAVDSGSFEYLYFDISNNSDGSFLFNMDNTGRFIIAEDAVVSMYYDASGNEFVFFEDINSDGGIVDIGSDAQDFDDVWCDELHYFTLTARSDERIKNNIKPLQYGLKELLMLEPISYQFNRRDKKIRTEIIENKEKPVTKAQVKKRDDRLARKEIKLQERLDKKAAVSHFGFSAQKVAEIMPELTVNTEASSKVGTAAIKQTEMTAVLVNAIKQLAGQVSELQSEVKTLRGG